jgi:hypothetical protein
MSNRTHSAMSANDRTHYGKALRSTNQALQDPSEGIRDGTLTAIWLLGVHEVYCSVDTLTSNAQD